MAGNKKGTKVPKISEANIGNKNAVKDDRQEVIDKCIIAIDGMKSGEFKSLFKACFKVGFTLDDVSYWEDKYKGDKAVFRIVKELRSNAEVAVLNATEDGNCPQAFGMFILKSKYGWIDQPQQADTTPPKFVFKIER